MNHVPLTRPAPALPKDFKTNQDRILYYINLADYLSTKQIIMLCYAHLSTTSQKAAASRDLKQLVETKRVKAQFVGKEKIYFVGKSCSPTTHNLAIRELFVKVERSGFEIARVDFCRKLGGLTPDLAIDFVLPDGQHLAAFWEYDAGTEGIAELESKIGRYARGRGRAGARVRVRRAWQAGAGDAGTAASVLCARGVEGIRIAERFGLPLRVRPHCSTLLLKGKGTPREVSQIQRLCCAIC